MFIFRHKRKVQNFFPCKTPTRGHIDTTISGGHSVAYEDPDAHMGRRPLVMRHHNMEVSLISFMLFLSFYGRVCEAGVKLSFFRTVMLVLKTFYDFLVHKPQL